MKYAFISSAFVALCLVCCSVTAADAAAEPAELTEEQQRIAAAEKTLRLKEMAEEVKEAEKAVKEKQRTRDKEQIQNAKDDLSSARKKLAAGRQRTDQEWLDSAQIRKANDHLAASNKEDAKKSRPLSIEALGLHSNVINLPQLVVVTANNTRTPVEAYTVSAECFNKFDEPVSDISGNNVFSGISQDTIQAGQKGKSSWQMSLHRNTAYARVWLTRVRFSDGTEWHQTKDEALSRRKAIFRIDMD
jgi:hypothetical protein